MLHTLKMLARRAAWRSRLSLALSRAQRGIRVIMVHAVGDADCPLNAFREQLRWLRDHFCVAPFSEIVADLNSGKGSGRKVALTFDDGLRNTLQFAYPILQELRLPAAIFVCPGVIDEAAWLWNHDCRERLRSLEASARAQLASRIRAPAANPNPVVEWIKTLPLEERREVHNAIRNATPDFRPSPEQKKLFDIMTWPELSSLDPALITIGAHTMTHPILTTLADEELEREVRASRSVLEQRLGRPAPFFCYPNGSHDGRVAAVVASCFAAAVTTEPGIAADGTALHRIPRIPIAESTPSLAWRFHRPRS